MLPVPRETPLYVNKESRVADILPFVNNLIILYPDLGPRLSFLQATGVSRTQHAGLLNSVSPHFARAMFSMA